MTGGNGFPEDQRYRVASFWKQEERNLSSTIVKIEMANA